MRTWAYKLFTSECGSSVKDLSGPSLGFQEITADLIVSDIGQVYGQCLNNLRGFSMAQRAEYQYPGLWRSQEDALHWIHVTVYRYVRECIGGQGMVRNPNYSTLRKQLAVSEHQLVASIAQKIVREACSP